MFNFSLKLLSFFILFSFFFIFFLFSQKKGDKKNKIKVTYSASKIFRKGENKTILEGNALLKIKNYRFSGNKIVIYKKEKKTYCFGDAKIINETNQETYSSEIILFDSEKKKIYGFLKSYSSKQSVSQSTINPSPNQLNLSEKRKWKLSSIDRENLKVKCHSFALQLNGEDSFFTNEVDILSTKEEKNKIKKTFLYGDFAFYNSKTEEIKIISYSNRNTKTITDEYYIIAKKTDIKLNQRFLFKKNVKLYSIENKKTNITIFGNELIVKKKKDPKKDSKGDIVECHTNVIFHDIKEDNKIFSDYLKYDSSSRNFYFSKKPILINKKKEFSIAANELDGNTKEELLFGKGDVFLTNKTSVVSGIILRYKDKKNMIVSGGNVIVDEKDKIFQCEEARYNTKKKEVKMINVTGEIDKF